MTDSPRQLPGVKGQWIKASDCPPTARWADSDGEVRVYDPRVDQWGSTYLKIDDVTNYWCPADYRDTRPFTLKPATTERRIVQLMRHNELVYAVADDGTAWMRFAGDDDSWHQMRGLPPREA